MKSLWECISFVQGKSSIAHYVRLAGLITYPEYEKTEGRGSHAKDCDMTKDTRGRSVYVNHCDTDPQHDASDWEKSEAKYAQSLE